MFPSKYPYQPKLWDDRQVVVIHFMQQESGESDQHKHNLGSWNAQMKADG